MVDLGRESYIYLLFKNSFLNPGTYLDFFPEILRMAVGIQKTTVSFPFIKDDGWGIWLVFGQILLV